VLDRLPELAHPHDEEHGEFNYTITPPGRKQCGAKIQVQIQNQSFYLLGVDTSLNADAKLQGTPTLTWSKYGSPSAAWEERASLSSQ